jgi:hypothetical protein
VCIVRSVVKIPLRHTHTHTHTLSLSLSPTTTGAVLFWLLIVWLHYEILVNSSSSLTHAAVYSEVCRVNSVECSVLCSAVQCKQVGTDVCLGTTFLLGV